MQHAPKTLSVISGAEVQQEKPVSCLEWRQRENRQARLAGWPRSHRGQCVAAHGGPGPRDTGMNLASWTCRVPPPARGPWHPWLLPHQELLLWPQNKCSGLCSLFLRSPAEKRSALFHGKMENGGRKVVQKGGISSLDTLMGGCGLWKLDMLPGLMIY